MLNFKEHIQPAILNSMINIRDKEYTNDKDKEIDLSYNLALSEILVKLSDTDNFMNQVNEISDILNLK